MKWILFLLLPFVGGCVVTTSFAVKYQPDPCTEINASVQSTY